MAREFFKNLPNTTTPLTASRMNALLDGDEPMGNIVVDSIKTKNLFNQELLKGIEGWSKTNNYYNGAVSTLYSYYLINGIYTGFETNTQYTISCTCYATTSNSNVRFKITYTDNTTEISPYFPINIAGQITKTSTANKTISKITFDYSNQTNVYIKDMQLEKGTTATTFSNYQELNIECSEGTWTPSIAALNESAPTVTYTNQIGKYKKIGKIVFVSFYIRAKITALNGTNNFACLTGLPYTASTISFGSQALNIGILYSAVTNDTNCGFLVNGNIIRIQYMYGASSINWKVTPTSYMEIGGSGFYFID